jgi:hypothetical protein
MQALSDVSSLNKHMNMYVHALQQHDKRPTQPVVIACNKRQLQKKLIFERMLEEESMLHAHSADTATGGYDGGGGEVDFSYDNEITFRGPRRDLLFRGGNLTLAHAH